jgi:hypothetical protein
MLTDDFVADDPLMGESGADAFVAKIRQSASAGGGGSTEILTVVGGDEVVAALTRFRSGQVSVMFSQWFWVRDGKLRRQQAVYDPRPFLALRG